MVCRFEDTCIARYALICSGYMGAYCESRYSHCVLDFDASDVDISDLRLVNIQRRPNKGSGRSCTYMRPLAVSRKLKAVTCIDSACSNTHCLVPRLYNQDITRLPFTNHIIHFLSPNPIWKMPRTAPAAAISANPNSFLLLPQTRTSLLCRQG